MICEFCKEKIIDTEKQCTKTIDLYPIEYEIYFCSKECKILHELIYLERFHREKKTIDNLIDEQGYTEQEVFDALIYLEKISPSSLSKLNCKDFGRARILK